MLPAAAVPDLPLVRDVVVGLYLLVFTAAAVYGLHRLWMVWRFFIVRRGVWRARPQRRLDRLPRVTVQLPMYNEPLVAERAIEAACALDYPRHLLHVQVLDDSDGRCAAIARRCCERMRARGHDVQYVHRRQRTGYKAGALAAGLAEASGELIAVFDADFVPPPSFLRRMIHWFADEDVGMVQARWSHLNRDVSLLTRLQAVLIDAHFIVEQTVRAGTGRWFNFNGTAGIWRRACIEQAGGWQHDTLAEDTDLSYRAQLAGWRFIYAPRVMCPAELPPTISAFLSQQHRWNKGLIQTAMKLLPRIERAEVPGRLKVEALFHLTCPMMYPLVLLLAMLLGPLAVATPTAEVSTSRTLNASTVVALGVGSVAAVSLCLVAQLVQRERLLVALARVVGLMALGAGISVVTTRAVIEALLRRPSPFVRTPKFSTGWSRRALRTCSDHNVQRPLLRPWRGHGLVECSLGVMALCCVVLAMLPVRMSFGTGVAVPFLTLFSAGLFGVGLGRVRSALLPAPQPEEDEHGDEGHRVSVETPSAVSAA